MRPTALTEKISLIIHIASMLFGLAGLLIVLPRPEIIISLPPPLQTLFQLSMAGGGVVYIIFGALAVALYLYRNCGLSATLGFALPAIFLSLSSELLGTSTGFPFGHYAYLNGLGYKIAGLVPFTIPLSWFYMGAVCYLLARSGLRMQVSNSWLKEVGAIALGALLLTAWDFVLDPAMSQSPFPFWEFQETGAFFGMPYRNITGWLGTGAVFITVAALFWKNSQIALARTELKLPLIVYLVNFAFGALITLVALDTRFILPTILSIILGVIPAIILWWLSVDQAEILKENQQKEFNTGNLPDKQVVNNC